MPFLCSFVLLHLQLAEDLHQWVVLKDHQLECACVAAVYLSTKLIPKVVFRTTRMEAFSAVHLHSLMAF